MMQADSIVSTLSAHFGGGLNRGFNAVEASRAGGPDLMSQISVLFLCFGKVSLRRFSLRLPCHLQHPTIRFCDSIPPPLLLRSFPDFLPPP